MKLCSSYWTNKNKNLDLDYPRGLKRVSCGANLARDPVVEGDKANFKLPSPRPEHKISEEYQRMASFGRFQPGANQESFSARKERLLYEEKNGKQADLGIFGASKGLQRTGPPGMKSGAEMNSLIRYSSADRYREQHVSKKINNNEFNEVIFAGLERDRASYKPLKGISAKRIVLF